MSASYYIPPECFDLAKENGIKRQTLESRVYTLGWDPHRAATEKPRKCTNRDKWKAIAQQNGISANTFLRRINKCGWSEEKAATHKIMTNQESGLLAWTMTDKDIKLPKELIQLAASNGICRSTLEQRVYVKHWDALEAATKPIMDATESLQKARETYKNVYGSYWHQKTVVFKNRDAYRERLQRDLENKERKNG